jgi:hypothetical protein
MDLDGDPNSDLQSLSGATLASVSEVEDRDQDELLGAGSSKSTQAKSVIFTNIIEDFHWRIRITPPDTRRFALSSRSRSREIVGVLSCNRLPGTIAEFRVYLSSRCPNTAGRGFRLRCAVWPTSPYVVVPVQFSGDLHFSNMGGEEAGGNSETSEGEAVKYRNLIQGCRVFARECQRREVEFEIKIVFAKG